MLFADWESVLSFTRGTSDPGHIFFPECRQESCSRFSLRYCFESNFLVEVQFKSGCARMRLAFRVQKVMLMVCSKSFFFLLEIWEQSRKSRPLHHARLANETQGFSISDR